MSRSLNCSSKRLGEWGFKGICVTRDTMNGMCALPLTTRQHSSMLSEAPMGRGAHGGHSCNKMVPVAERPQSVCLKDATDRVGLAQKLDEADGQCLFKSCI